jgi:hypothetical protein
MGLQSCSGIPPPAGEYFTTGRRPEATPTLYRGNIPPHTLKNNKILPLVQTVKMVKNVYKFFATVRCYLKIDENANLFSQVHYSVA